MENMHYNMPAAQNQQAQGQQSDTKQKTVAPAFNVKDFLIMLAFNWYWIVLAGIVAFAIAFVYARSLQPQYQRVTDIQIQEQQAEAADISKFMGLQDPSKSVNMSNELYIIHSLKLASQVAEQLHMDVRYYTEGTFRRVYLYGNQPFTAKFAGGYIHNLTIGIRPETMETFHITSLRVDGHEVSIPEQDDFAYYFGSDFQLPITEEVLSLNVTDANYPALTAAQGKDVYIERVSPDVAAYRCQSMLETETKASTVVRIICTASSVAEADAVLREVTKAYNAQSIEAKNASAKSSADFVEERINETARELGETSDQLSSIGVSALTESASTAASAIGSASEKASAQDMAAKVQADLTTARALRTRMQQAIATKDYIPALPGFGDAGVGGQISAYNQLIQERENLIKNSSVDNPAVRKRDALIESMERTMLGAIDGYIEGLASQSRLAYARVARISSSEASAAKTAGYDSTALLAKSLGIAHKYKESYFQHLLEMREELRLQLAITDASTKVVEDPMGSTEPVYPQPKTIYLQFVAVGLLIPIAVIALILFLSSTIRGRKDVEDALTMPFVGEIPANENKKKKKSWVSKLMYARHQGGARQPHRRQRQHQEHDGRGVQHRADQPHLHGDARGQASADYLLHVVCSGRWQEFRVAQPRLAAGQQRQHGQA